jgi:hypothetical protein
MEWLIVFGTPIIALAFLWGAASTIHSIRIGVIVWHPGGPTNTLIRAQQPVQFWLGVLLNIVTLAVMAWLVILNLSHWVR